MKAFIIYFSLFCNLLLASENEIYFKVLSRNDNKKPQVTREILTDLISSVSFDGRYFKIVKGKSSEAIKFDEDENLTFRAATAYFHLTQARNYFINLPNSDFVKNLPKIVIRIEHTNQFSELGHFAHDNLSPQFNNALSIPAGEGLSRRGVKPWGIEIWFRPAKKIHLSELNSAQTSTVEVQALMSNFRRQIHMQSFQRFLTSSILALSYPGASSPLSIDNIIRTAGASVIMEAAYQFTDPLTKIFSRKWYKLDTALIPEIIYHEYAHVALSDHLVLSHSSPVIEGMADYFAGQIANSPKLAMHIKKYNTFSGKNALRKQDYKLAFETNDYANTDFVFGLLWDLKKIIGDKEAELFVFNLRKKITTNSSIRVDLIDGILKTCDEVCSHPFTDKLNILKKLNLKHL